MKLIFEQDGVRREIVGPFNLTASAADLETLREQIDVILAPRDPNNSDRSAFHYGRVTIWPRPVGAPSGTPRKWAEP